MSNVARLLLDDDEPYGAKRDVCRVVLGLGYNAPGATSFVRFDGREISVLQDGHFQWCRYSNDDAGTGN